jgi:D-methionine transport system permease protein
MILLEALRDTILMTVLASSVTFAVGLPLGMLLYGSMQRFFIARKSMRILLDLCHNSLSSLPYLAITVLCLPLTSFLIKHHCPGTLAAIIPLTLASAPLFAKSVLELFSQVPKDFAYTAEAIGATPWGALTKVYLPQVLPNLLQMFSKTVTTILSYSTIAGLFGAGGLGYILIEYGYNQFHIWYLAISALLLVLLFKIVEYMGMLASLYTSKTG